MLQRSEAEITLAYLAAELGVSVERKGWRGLTFVKAYYWFHVPLATQWKVKANSEVRKAYRAYRETGELPRWLLRAWEMMDTAASAVFSSKTLPERQMPRRVNWQQICVELPRLERYLLRFAYVACRHRDIHLEPDDPELIKSALAHAEDYRSRRIPPHFLVTVWKEKKGDKPRGY